MTQKTKKREAFRCPETNGSDYERYPLVSEGDFMMMEQDFFSDTSIVRVFPFFRKVDEETWFIELYFWDIMLYPEQYKRFVICDGHRLPDSEEKCFLRYVRNSHPVLDQGRLNHLYDVVCHIFPEWHFAPYSKEQSRLALEHLYHVSHPSGAKEILYKAGLCNIAWNMDRVALDEESHATLKNTPEYILGTRIPLRLLRILNQPQLIYKLFSREEIRKTIEVYRKYAGYITEELPSAMQWRYLTMLYDNSGTFANHGFLRSLYKRLTRTTNSHIFSLYEEFFAVREEIKDFWKVRIPDTGSVEALLENMRVVRDCLNERLQLDAAIRERSIEKWDYEGEKYVVRIPDSFAGFLKESVDQKNCLIDCLKRHAEAKLTILFVRRKALADHSFVVMEVIDSEITQIHNACNGHPDKEVYAFIGEYAKSCGLKYDPYDIIERETYCSYYGTDEVRSLIEFAQTIRDYCCSVSSAKEETLCLIRYRTP